MITITCPDCGSPLTECRKAGTGIVKTLCANSVLKDIEASVKKLKITDALSFSEHMPQSSIIYSGPPSQSRSAIWAELTLRVKGLDYRTAATVQRDRIIKASDATDRRLEKEIELAPAIAAEKESAIQKITAKFNKILAAA